ncbi:nuclear pore complex subunit [Dispira simplex]|nr:nuclear pore complex subunit [Dispira simplex]
MLNTTSANRLQQLLEESQRLTSNITSGDVPTINRGLGQIEEESRRLLSKSILDRGAQDSNGHYLLASGGVDADRLSSAVQSFNLGATFEPIQSIPDGDVEGYLQYQREQLIINALESGYRETCQDFESTFERHLQADWEKTKNRLLEELGQQSTTEAAQISAASPMSHRRPFTTVGDESLASGGSRRRDRGSTSLKMNPRMLHYARGVGQVNQARLHNNSLPVMDLFEKVTHELSDDDRSQQITASWHMLTTILDEHVPNEMLGAGQALTEAEFSVPYLYSTYYSPASVQVRNHFIRGARRYLEEQFVEYVDRTLTQFPREASIGGVPSINHKIRGYLNVKLNRLDPTQKAQLEVSQGQAMWAHLYYLFRAGCVTDALSYAMQHEPFFMQSERNFLTYLKAYVDSVDHRLPRNLRDRLHADFNRYARNTHDAIDSYKFAMMKIVGRCELGRKSIPEVVQATEDYMWLQLALIRESEQPSEESYDERYTLRDLQKLLLRFGPAHFNPKGNNPMLYFQVLLLSAQFEQAIGFLLQLGNYHVEAVHFALALAYYGLLHITPLNLQMGALDYLTTIPTTIHVNETLEVAHLNFNRILGDYVHRFAPTDATDALQYVILFGLRGLTSPDDTARIQHQMTLCHESILSLLLDTGDYATLLGDVQKDGAHTMGLLEQFADLIGGADDDQLLLRLTKQAAERCRQEGRLGDAILLYDKAKEYDTVITVLNHQLGEILASPAERRLVAQDSSRLPDTATNDSTLGLSLKALAHLTAPDFKRMAENILSHYLKLPDIHHGIEHRHKKTCAQLTSLLDFMVAYEDGRLDTALMIIEKLDLIPLNGDVACITQQAERLRDLDEAISRNFPEVLLATMDTLSRLHAQIKQSQFMGTTKQAELAQLRRKGRSVMVLAGMIQFRMPPNTYSRLNRLDVFMH